MRAHESYKEDQFESEISIYDTEVKVFKNRSNFKVIATMSELMVPCERSCHKQYACAIWKPYFF